MKNRLLPVLVAATATAAACNTTPTTSPPDAAAPATSSAQPPAAEKPRPPPATREGGALVRAAAGDALYLADEDHAAVRRVPLLAGAAAPAQQIQEIKVPGPPAQVLALADRVLVTIRDPGMLLILRPDPAAGLVEAARVPVPDDAWGVAVSADEKIALVSSAWTHQVSAVDLGVDLGAAAKRWSVDVPREPRGIAIRADGAAYVTHLVGSSLTRIDDIAGAAPKVRAVPLPPSPLRAPSGKVLGASLGYAAALSDDGGRLFVARHALGAMGIASWFGAATVDVLITATDRPLAPPHHGNLPVALSEPAKGMPGSTDVNLPIEPLTPFVQPRAVAYRKSTKTILVAGEGNDALVELDALAVDPTLMQVATYKVGGSYDPHLSVAGTCGAPAGLALSEDESTAWVFCRSTYDLATVRLAPVDQPAPQAMPASDAKKGQAVASVVHLADDPLPEDEAKGRRLFYNATDTVTSGGLACAGCHPEGRDDGYVWHEAEFDTLMLGRGRNFVGRPENVPLNEVNSAGYPRQTPMLAGRVRAKGPYGWHAESQDLVARLKAGFGLHRWGVGDGSDLNLTARALFLAKFLRAGLAPPPRLRRELTKQEERGREIFVSEEARCAKCHDPQTDYTDRMAYPLTQVRLPRFDPERDNQFKTPSLLYVGGTPPYFHDGHVDTLEALVERNNDRMGRTNHLSKEDQAALVAFLKTL